MVRPVYGGEREKREYIKITEHENGSRLYQLSSRSCIETLEGIAKEKKVSFAWVVREAAEGTSQTGGRCSRNGGRWNETVVL